MSDSEKLNGFGRISGQAIDGRFQNFFPAFIFRKKEQNLFWMARIRHTFFKQFLLHS